MRDSLRDKLDYAAAAALFLSLAFVGLVVMMTLARISDWLVKGWFS